MQTATRPIGGHLREWRQRWRLSQLALACDAEISTKHLSFIETGRSSPSHDMVLRLAERLEVPLRERNRLLLAAGYAPVFPERPPQDPALVRRARSSISCSPATSRIRHWQSTAIGR
jgi:transcriptional regulator with XRE-family HTH domain